MEIEQQDDRRNDIAAAIESMAPAESTPATDTAPATPSDPASQPVDAKASEPSAPVIPEGKARDEQGRFIKADGKPAPEKPAVAPTPTPEVKPDAQVPTQAKPPTEPVQPAKTFKAPGSWQPAAREHWAKLPVEAQSEIVRRERETAIALQESAEARQFRQKFAEATTPYEPLFRAQGVDAMQATQFLLQQYSAMSTAPVHTRAQTLANWIRTFLPGDEGVQLLSTALASAPQQAPQQYQPPVMRDPRVDEIYARITQAEQERARSLQAQAGEAISEVENEEFFNDVRLIMADLVEVAGRNGLRLSLQDAYNRAVMMHPEISRVIEQRKVASANLQGSTEKAANAASSVRSNPASQIDSRDQRDDMRGAIEAAWSKAGGGR